MSCRNVHVRFVLLLWLRLRFVVDSLSCVTIHGSRQSHTAARIAARCRRCGFIVVGCVLEVRQLVNCVSALGRLASVGSQF